MSVRYEKMQNSFLAVSSMFSAMTVASVCPLWRMEANSAPKSCMAPKKMPPMSTHRSTGTQPKMAAWMGPLMGPAPAMDEKWWPIRTAGLAGTKSLLSNLVCAGVGRSGFTPHFLASQEP